MSCKVMLGSKPLATSGADKGSVVGVDPHLVSIHLPLAHGNVATNVAAMLLGADMTSLGAEAMVHPGHVVVQGCDVGELLGRLSLFFAYLTFPVALLQVDAHHMALDTEHLLCVVRAVAVDTQPVARLWVSLQVFAALLPKEMGRLIGQASLAPNLKKNSPSSLIHVHP